MKSATRRVWRMDYPRCPGLETMRDTATHPNRTQYTGGRSALSRCHESPPSSLIQTLPVVLPKASVRPSALTSSP